MDLSGVAWLAKGLLMGFAIAAPVGPIGVLCIRRTLAEGWLTGFLTGLAPPPPMDSTEESPPSG